MSIPKDYPCINSKDTHDNDNPLLEYQDGHLIGKNPLATDVFLLQDAGHEQTPISKVIRKKCLDCCGFQQSEVRKCVSTSCDLWPYRMGKDPFKSAQCKARGQKINLDKVEG